MPPEQALEIRRAGAKAMWEKKRKQAGKEKSGK